jgi:hypothetical protein
MTDQRFIKQAFQDQSRNPLRAGNGGGAEDSKGNHGRLWPMRKYRLLPHVWICCPLHKVI